MLAPLSGMAPGFVNQLERIVCESGYIFDLATAYEVFRSESIDLLARKFLAPNYIRFYLSFSISIQHCCCILPDGLLGRTIGVRLTRVGSAIRANSIFIAMEKGKGSRGNSRTAATSKLMVLSIVG